MGHVLNLCIKAFWFGDVGGINEVLDVVVVTDETMVLGRKIGP